MRYSFLRFPQGKTKAVTFSYDDGVRSDIRLAETLTQNGMKCTFNQNGGLNEHLTKEEVQKYILENGHEIAVHGYLHRFLNI